MKYLLHSFIILFLQLSLNYCVAQTYFDFGFARNLDVPCLVNDYALKLPWGGGMNSVRFSPIDLNLDGTNDLIAFEKHGNRILPFLLIDNIYVYAPEYVRLFPKLHDWVILKDFNGDGKMDIFTYGLAGIRVFENISDNQLDFSLVADPLLAYYYNDYINLYASPDDYLVVEDVDNDGKFDILNFYVLGKYVHFLKNYASDDSLFPFDLRLEDECWGKFSEAADNNTITLLTNCQDGRNWPIRHTGSSLLLNDFTNNGLPDLLVGDVDSPNLILLRNNGTISEPIMTQQDTAFPTNFPVELYSMPAASLINLYNSENQSLIVSPSDPSLTKSQDLNSVWRYDYDNNLNQYTLVEQNFLQSEMIDVGSGAQPVLFDFDNDGLFDLFIGNYGQFDSAKLVDGFLQSHFSSSISYYKNTGTINSPQFTLQTRDFGNLKQYGYTALHPTFGDLTNDGQIDMLCGNSDGKLILIPHSRLISNQGVILENFANIDVGDFSTPQLFDLENDGKIDLLIGNRRGHIAYYKNIGVNSTDFQHITDTLGNVDTRDINITYFGYCNPCFYRDDIHGTTLFCGNESGEISLYKDIDNNINNSFLLAERQLVEIINGNTFSFLEGRRVCPAVADLNGDGFPEIIIGNYAGGLSLFSGVTPPPHTNISNFYDNIDIKIFPNPTLGNFKIESGFPIKTVEIFNLLGQKIYEIHENLNYSAEIVLKNVNNGIYFAKINDNKILKVIVNQ